MNTICVLKVDVYSLPLSFFQGELAFIICHGSIVENDRSCFMHYQGRFKFGQQDFLKMSYSVPIKIEHNIYRLPIEILGTDNTLPVPPHINQPSP